MIDVKIQKVILHLVLFFSDVVISYWYLWVLSWVSKAPGTLDCHITIPASTLTWNLNFPAMFNLNTNRVETGQQKKPA